MTNDHYPRPSDTIDLSRFPEHTVEVDASRTLVDIDNSTYNELLMLDEDKIEARAAELGVPVNRGIVPIMVDGERQFIETDILDFGTRVRNVIETEKNQEDTAIRREIGDTALDAVAMDHNSNTTVPEVEEPETAETSKGEADAGLEQFSQAVETILGDFLGQSRNAYATIEQHVEALETSRRNLQRLFEEVNNHSTVILRTLYDSETDPMMLVSRLRTVNELLSQTRLLVQQKIEPTEGIDRSGRQLGENADHTAVALNTQIGLLGGVMVERMAEAKQSGQVVDDTTMQAVLAKGSATKGSLVQVQEAAEGIGGDARRLNSNDEEMAQRLNQAAVMCEDIELNMRRGRGVDAEGYRALHQLLNSSMGEYDMSAGSALMHLRASLEEIDLALASVRNINS
jgi:hypothetical protein